MTNASYIKNLITPEFDKLIVDAKASLNEVKSVALSQAWKILQLAVVGTIQIVENVAVDLVGKDKKSIAMEFLSKFYDSVFIVVDIPFVPNFVEPIIHKHIKNLLMIMVGSTIDAMVTTFRNAGIFKDPSSKIDTSIDVKPKVSEK
jgi:hypothetical protein